MRGGAIIRLRRPEEFRAVLRRGRVAAGPSFLVRALPNDADTPRLGIVASRRTIRRAVGRSACKRLIREAFRASQGFLNGVDVVVVCRREIPPGERKAAREELSALLQALQGGQQSLGRSPDPQQADGLKAWIRSD